MSSDINGVIVVGLMSGTSLDGISAAVVKFTSDETTGRLRVELLSFVQKPFTTETRSRIASAMVQGSARDYCRLNVDMGNWLAAAANSAIAETDVPRSHIACVASHGQTMWHEPGHSTWQIGDASAIAERTGCRVIADFRARDVAAGGQGAPLVPMADALLFAHETEWCLLQNIGGIGNVTVVPPISAGDDQLRSIRAFDTGPGVVLIDDVVRTLYPHLTFDSDGTIAATGREVNEVIARRLAHEYFIKAPPKSTGRELFSHQYTNAFIDECRVFGASDADIVATAVGLTAESIALQYSRFIPEPVGSVILSGGGARNPTLVRRIRRALSDNGFIEARSLEQFSDRFFDGDAREAVSFALLGYLAIMGLPANVPTATGARGARILGVTAPA